MIKVEINEEHFGFRYIQDFAKHLLTSKLEEFVTVGIRFCREADLPMLRPLSKFSEAELTAMSLDSNRTILQCLVNGTITAFIRENMTRWIDNSIGGLDKDEIVAEDITLVYYLKRKIFAYFLDGYTKNVVLQKLIIGEIDVYTTQEELVALDVYMQMQKEEITKVNDKLIHHQNLLLEAQVFGGIGSYIIDFKNRANSFYSPEYRRILNVDDNITFEEFMEHVHPEDRPQFLEQEANMSKDGGPFELEYRFTKDGIEKRIWTRGVYIADNKEPVLSRGTIRDVTSL